MEASTAPEQVTPLPNAAGGYVTFTDLLGLHHLAELCAQATPRIYRRGETLFYEYQPSEHLVLLRTGHVKLTCMSEGGREAVLSIRGPGDLVGEMSAFDGGPRATTATAMEPVEGLVLSTAVMIDLMHREPQVALSVIHMFSAHLRDANRKRLEYASSDCRGRIAARLTELADRFGEPHGDALRITLPISQEELASWTGCSRETVTKALHMMRDLGWIETQRRCFIVFDLDPLRDRAGLPRW